MITLEKVWITKYALTKGILVVEGAEMPSPNKHQIVVRQRNKTSKFSGKDWHASEAMAVLRVMKMLAEQRQKIAIQLGAMAQAELSYKMGTYIVTPLKLDSLTPVE